MQTLSKALEPVPSPSPFWVLQAASSGNPLDKTGVSIVPAYVLPCWLAGKCAITHGPSCTYCISGEGCCRFNTGIWEEISREGLPDWQQGRAEMSPAAQLGVLRLPWQEAQIAGGPRNVVVVITSLLVHARSGIGAPPLPPPPSSGKQGTMAGIPPPAPGQWQLLWCTATVPLPGYQSVNAACTSHTAGKGAERQCERKPPSSREALESSQNSDWSPGNGSRTL